VALPLLASLQSDLPRLKRAFQLAMSLVCTILYSTFLGIGVLAPEVVQVLFGAKWLPSAPYVAALSCLVLVQAPRVLVSPLLTALGRPKDLVVGKAVEFGFVLAAVAATQVPSLSWAVGIWIARELVALPVNIAQLRRASHFGVIEQFRGAFLPLVASLGMASVVLGVKYALPPSFGPVSRLLTLVPIGALSFALLGYVLDKPLVKTLLDFARSALAKTRGATALKPSFAVSRSP
jgi:PST family polysaccharide transporter